MIKAIKRNKKLAVGTFLTVFVILALISLSVALLLQNDISKLYGAGVMIFAGITFLAIKIMSDSAAMTGELKGWGEAYDANGRNLRRGNVYPGWIFKEAASIDIKGKQG